MNIAALLERRQLRRKVHGIAAALLPFELDGSVAVDAFKQHLTATHQAGLMNAVNMDTGYVNYLSEPEKRDVLRWTVEALGKNVPFVGGAYIENQTGDIVALYRQQMDSIIQAGGLPIMFQSSRLHGLSPKEKASVYRAACQGYQHVLAFELGTMFAPNGEIFDEDTVRRLMDIPELKGMKHSSLDRLVELKRLALRDEQRPEFRM
jgi:dihydrodipicolinate synthase/N-acetylneuraminate lyase